MNEFTINEEGDMLVANLELLVLLYLYPKEKKIVFLNILTFILLVL